MSLTLRGIGCIVWLVALCACKREGTVYDCYNSTTNDSQFDLSFELRGDSFFVSYVYAMDNGKYLNAPAHDSDFAGYFLRKDVLSGSTAFEVKSYRDETDSYVVKLTFSADHRKVTWKVLDEGPVAFLPKKIDLNVCR